MVAPHRPRPCSNRSKSKSAASITVKLSAASVSWSDVIRGNSKWSSNILKKRLQASALPVTPMRMIPVSMHWSVLRISTSSPYFFRSLVLQLGSVMVSYRVGGWLGGGEDGGGGGEAGGSGGSGGAGGDRGGCGGDDGLMHTVCLLVSHGAPVKIIAEVQHTSEPPGAFPQPLPPH